MRYKVRKESRWYTVSNYVSRDGSIELGAKACMPLQKWLRKITYIECKWCSDYKNWEKSSIVIITTFVLLLIINLAISHSTKRCII